MSLKIDRVQLEIIVQNDTARQNMLKLEGQMKSARDELNKVKKQFGENSTEYKAQEKVVKDLQKQYDKLFEGLGIGKLSLKELCNRQKELNSILRNMDPSLPQWKQYNDQLKEVNNRIKELKQQAKDTSFSLSKLSEGFNKYAAMGAAAVASLTGVALTARKCTDEFASMMEAESQVKKYTGMTTEEVDNLNESLKRLDTRTARERLNELAGDAGKLGIQGKESILEFVDAANIINVSLGEDLGKDAVKNIGKLAQMFGEDKKLGLRGAMLATGSAINEVAQNSSAAESYLANFTARVSGAANQAHIAQANIIGLASVLDQNMQQEELAATAFQNLMMKMYQDPAKFAELAGKNVAEFTRLIKEDANEAILQFIETLGQKGGLSELAPMFQQMGLDGVRASGVISVLAQKIGDIREAQALANKAYKEGTSVVNEYNVQNNTVQAQIEKNKKKFQEIRIELGEKLLPVMQYMITTGSLTVKGLSLLVSSVIKYRAAIITITVIIGTYIAALKLYHLWLNRVRIEELANITVMKMKAVWYEAGNLAIRALFAATSLLNGNVKMAKIGMIKFFETLKLNPYAAVATAVLACSVAIYKLATRTSEADKAMKEFLGTNGKEQSELRKLYKELKNSNEGSSERLRLMKEFNSKYGGYLDNLLSEKSTVEDIAKAYRDASSAISQKIATEMIEKKRNEILEKSTDDRGESMLDYQTALSKKLSASTANSIRSQTVDIVNEMIEGGKSVDEISTSIINGIHKKYAQVGVTDLADAKSALKDYIESVKEDYKQIKEIQDKLGSLISNKKNKPSNQLDEVVVTPSYNGVSGKNGSPSDPKDIEKAYQKKLQQLKAFQTAEENELKSSLIKQQITQEQYQEGIYATQIKYLAERREAMIGFKKDTTDLDSEWLDKVISESNRRAALFKKLPQPEEEEAPDEIPVADYLIEKFKKTNEFKKEFLRSQRENDLISEQEYQDKLSEINKEESEKRAKDRKNAMMAISDLGGGLHDLFSAMQDSEISKVESKYDKQIKAAKKAGKDTTKLEEKKEEEVNAVKKKYADKQFATAVLQVTSSTAVAAMEAYKSLASIPVIGPALGAAAAAAAIAAGAAQIAQAKQQRDEAKGLKEGGYSDDYVQGYTNTGNPDDVAGVIPVHKNEFVANHESVANPHVRQFLDIFDGAQKRGTIRMLNTTQILEQIRTRSGKYEGGYVSTGVPSGSNVSGTDGTLIAKIDRIIQLLDMIFNNTTDIKSKQLIVSVKEIRDGIKKIDKLESNVSR